MTGSEAIDAAGERLRAWVAAVAGAVVERATVSLDPPSPAADGRGVGLYLVELGPAPAGQGAGRPPLRLALRYLVTSWAEAPEVAHRLLGALAFAAMEVTELELELELRPLSPEAWAAFGVLPRPSFFLRLPVQLARPAPSAPPVLKPLVVHAVPTVALEGLVVGPGDVPLPGAQVELPGLKLTALTDGAGRFRFPRVPAAPETQALRVLARGRERRLTASTAPDRAPLVIRVGLGDGRDPRPPMEE